MTVFAGVVARNRSPVPSVLGADTVLEAHGASSVRATDTGVDLLARSGAGPDAADAFAERRDEQGRLALAVVADAVLFERPALAAQLGCPGTVGTAELLLAGYERWGHDLPDHLLGRFAFAVIDRRPGAVDGVFLAVDHGGQRPLSFHVDDDRVAFASLALALTGIDGVGHELDVEHLAELVALAFGGPRSIVRGVEHVLPGTSVWITSGSVERRRWWRPEPPGIRDLRSLEAHGRELADALDRVTSDAIDGFARLGVSLSGGLDSTSVAATAARLRPGEPIRTYTSVPPLGWDGRVRPGWDADERELVVLLAARYPELWPRWVEARGRGLLVGCETWWELGLPPQRNAANLMWLRILEEEAAADGVDLLLSGALGNRHFSADGPRWLFELARRGRLARVWSETRAWSAATGEPSAAVLRDHLVRYAVPTSLRRRRRVRRGRTDPVTGWLGATALAPSRHGTVDLSTSLPHSGELDVSRWTRRTSDLFVGAPMVAESTAVARSVYGFDQVDPTSDRRIVELALTQPEWWRRHQGVDRAIVRAAMADRLPDEIVRRRRRGEQLPDWFDRLADARDEIDDEVAAADDHPTTRDVIDTARLRTLVREWPPADDPHAARSLAAYRLALPRALLLSKYARWFEERARRTANHR